jgi:Chitobiase/beta-hexosaminidase C-terminal domain/Clostridial hydrophobic W
MQKWVFQTLVLKMIILVMLINSSLFAQTLGSVSIMAHVQNRGWIGPFTSDQVAGTVGQSLRLEAVEITASDRHICYQAHVQNLGWQSKVCDGAVAGTTGRSLRMEALRIWVDRGHVVYFGHVQNIGWTGPFEDGATAGTTGQSLRLEAISVQTADDSATLAGSTRAFTTQTGVLRVQRDIFRNGGWGFNWRRPTPFNDGYNYGEAGIQLRLGDVIPPGSIVTSAVLNWSFTNFSAQTSATRPNPGAELGGDHAKAARIHGSNSLCAQICSPATINRWEPAAAHWPNRIQLNGQSLYWFPAPQSRDFSGSVNLLSIYPASALPGNTLTFYGTLQYGVGRPFFGTEGWNADTEFDVIGGAQVNISASVLVTFTAPAAEPTFAPGGGTYTSNQTVTITDDTVGASIYVTTDGTAPSSASPKYTGPITVNATKTVKAIAVASGHTPSAVASAAYTIQTPVPTGWQPLKNIFTGSVNQIVIDAGRVLYITTNGGIFKSSDGQTWSSASGDLPAMASGAIAADPLTPGIIYVWAGSNVFKTVNGGANWSKTNMALPAGVYVGNIVVAPTNPKKIYASTWGAYIQCSSDGALTWSQCGNGLFGGASGPAFTSSVAVSPVDANLVYTTTWRGFLFQSTNGGGNWSSIGGSPWANGQIHIAPSNPKVLYTINDEYWFGRGTVLKSLDAGQTWTDAGRPDGIASDAAQLAISPIDPNTVYATTTKGLFETTTGGGTWKLVFASTSSPQNLGSLALDTNNSKLYVGSPYTGFYESSDGGKNWSQQNTGIAAANVVGLDVCASDPSTIYVGAQSVGVLKTTNGGGVWTTVAVPQEEILSGLACHPQDPSIILISGYGSGASTIWKSVDGGMSLSAVANGYSPGVIAFNPTNPNLVNASIGDWQGGILDSSDAGTSWTVPSFWYAYAGPYVYHPNRSNIVFTVANQYTGAAINTVNLAYSIDSGITWNPATFGQGRFAAMALDETDPTTLYVAGNIANEGTSGIYKFKVAYTEAGVLSITRVPGVFNTGLGSTDDIRQLIYNKASGYLYAATADGVYRSNNQAGEWTSLNPGLPYLLVNRIAVSPDGTRVFAGTNGGIYAITRP